MAQTATLSSSRSALSAGPAIVFRTAPFRNFLPVYRMADMVDPYMVSPGVLSLQASTLYGEGLLDEKQCDTSA